MENSIMSLDKIALTLIIGVITLGIAVVVVTNTNDVMFCWDPANDTWYEVTNFNDSFASVNLTLNTENHDTFIKINKAGSFINQSFLFSVGYGVGGVGDVEDVCVDVGDDGDCEITIAGNASNNYTILGNTTITTELFECADACSTEWCECPILVNTSTNGEVMIGGNLNVSYITDRPIPHTCDGDEGVVAGTEGAYESFADFLPIIVIVVLAGVIVGAIVVFSGRGR